MKRYVSLNMIEESKESGQSNREALKLMENKESWVLREKNTAEEIRTLFKNLERIVKDSEENRDNIIKIMAMVNTGYMVNLFGYIKNKNEAYLFEELINELNREKNEYSRLVVKRFLTLYRISTIPRVFSIERLEAVHREIKNINNR